MGRIGSLFVEIFAKTDKLNKGLKDSENKLDKFGKGINRIGGLIAGAFALSKVVAFTKEIINLAGQAEGVQAAFKRMGGQLFLEDLRKATRGTVSDLELMKRSVMAHNFQIPIKDLAMLFEFASRRAQETGESVNYLVNSIVVGIGRKAPLILDNLGISAVRLREELDQAGHSVATVGQVSDAVGKIAQAEMKKMGDVVVTATDRIAKMNAEWENTKKTLGQRLIPILNKFTDRINALFEELPRNRALEEFDSIIDSLKKMEKEAATLELKKRIKELTAEWHKLNEQKKVFQANMDRTFPRKGIIFSELQEDRLKTLDRLLNMFSKAAGGTAPKDIISKLFPEEPVKKTIGNITEMEEALKGMEEELKLLPTSSQRFKVLNDQIKQLKINMDALKEATGAPDLPTGFQGINTDAFAIDDFVLESYDDFIKTIDELYTGAGRLADQFEGLNASYMHTTGLAKKMNEVLLQGTDQMLSSAISSEQGLENLADTFAQTIRQIIKALIAEGVAHVVKDAMKTYGIKGIVIGAAAGTAAAAVFETVVPRFAQSGIVPGTQMTGDGVNARLNSGEMVLSRSHQSNLLNMIKNGNSMGGNVEFIIRGRDLHGVMREYDKQLQITG